MPHARSGEAKKLQAPHPRPRPSKEARLPRASDAADSLGLARLVLGAPWEQERQVWLWSFGPGDGGWRLASHGDSHCLEPKTQDHQAGNAKESKKLWREGTGTATGKKNCPPLLKGVRNFAPEFPQRILTFLDVLPRTHFPSSYPEGFLFVCLFCLPGNRTLAYSCKPYPLAVEGEIGSQQETWGGERKLWRRRGSSLRHSPRGYRRSRLEPPPARG
nr:uncharacterized protein LOC107401559 [Peromyscus maniculatus bairdii]